MLVIGIIKTESIRVYVTIETDRIGPKQTAAIKVRFSTAFRVILFKGGNKEKFVCNRKHFRTSKSRSTLLRN